MREMLLDEQNDLLKRMEGHDELNESMRDSDGELTHVDNHPADTATTMYEREKDFALHEHDRLRLENIEYVLKKMDEGTYGICERCGQDIGLERLEAVPTAIYCRAHQHEQISKHRPVEEDVLSDFRQFNFDNRDDETQFDAEDAWQAVAQYNELPNVLHEEIEPDEEARGFVEPIEGFIITDIEGNVVEESRDFERNRMYFSYLDRGEGEGDIWEDEVIFPHDEHQYHRYDK